MEYFQRDIVFLFYVHTPPPLQQLFVLVWHLKQISVAADLLKAVPVLHIVVLTISPCAEMVGRSLFPKHQCPSDSCSWLSVSCLHHPWDYTFLSSKMSILFHCPAHSLWLSSRFLFPLMIIRCLGHSKLAGSCSSIHPIPFVNSVKDWVNSTLLSIYLLANVRIYHLKTKVNLTKYTSVDIF